MLRERNNKVDKFVIFGITIIAIVVMGIVNPLYLFFFIGYLLAVLFSNSEKNEKLLQFCIYSILGSVILLIVDLAVLKNILKEPVSSRFVVFFSTIFFLLSFIPLSLLRQYFEKIKALSLSQKEYYKIPDKFPDLICDMHYVRTVEKSVLGHKIVHCRKSKKCYSLGRITHVKTLVGVIGDYKRSRKFADEYSSMIWQKETKTIYDGDYDVIEIREGNEIADYNAAVSRVVFFLYNQIRRRKPISEISIRIAGNPPLSESTKRLLEERFLKVEYLELNYKKLNYSL